MLLNCGVGENSWESHGQQGDPTIPSKRKSVLNSHWKDWCWSWNSNTLATWCKELTHLKRPWCWERSKAGGEGDGRGWDGWLASLPQWTWVWVSSRSWWWTGKPGVLQSMGRKKSDRTEWLDWTELNHFYYFSIFYTLSQRITWYILSLSDIAKKTFFISWECGTLSCPEYRWDQEGSKRMSSRVSELIFLKRTKRPF